MTDDFPSRGLVDTAWLAERLDDPGVRVLDATYVLRGSGRDARAEYARRHIPGALFFDIDDIADRATDLPHMLPDAKTFAAKAGALGVSDGSGVVVYDTHGLMSAARAWWMFRVFGHDRVAVLDGGLPKWLAEGRPVTDRVETAPAATFRAAFRPDLVRSADRVAAAIRDGAEQVVDARAAPRFTGEVDDLWPGRRRGHIPGSLNLPYTDLLDPPAGTLMPPDRLAARIAEAGIDRARQVVASCGSGVTAAVLALALHRVGAPPAAVYDGSWAEWGRRDDLPAELGLPRRRKA